MRGDTRERESLMPEEDEEYRTLDANCNSWREFYSRKAASYPLLEEVIAGKASFVSVVADLEKSYRAIASSALDLERKTIRILGTSFASALEVCCVALEDLSGQKLERYDQGGRFTLLVMMTNPREWENADPWRYALLESRYALFSQLRERAALVERIACLSYPERLLAGERNIFYERFRAVPQDHQAYIARRLQAVLKDGGLDMDQSELTRVLREAASKPEQE